MTTIAISDGVVAVDTQATGGNYVVRVSKLVRLPDGGVAVGCGNFKDAWAGLKWLADGATGETPEIEGAEIAIVRPDGQILVAEGRFPAYPILDRTYAMGCGADMARLAMAEGADPVTAVARACELDAMSSAPIMRMEAVSVIFPDATLHTVKRRKR